MRKRPTLSILHCHIDVSISIPVPNQPIYAHGHGGREHKIANTSIDTIATFAGADSAGDLGGLAVYAGPGTTRPGSEQKTKTSSFPKSSSIMYPINFRCHYINDRIIDVYSNAYAFHPDGGRGITE